MKSGVETTIQAAASMAAGVLSVRRAASEYAHHAAASHRATNAAPMAPPIAVTVGSPRTWSKVLRTWSKISFTLWSV